MKLGMWEIMAPAFFECLVLVGIHSYLGLHVIRRKVIFVDLALAQIAALGTTVGFLFGIMPDTSGAYWFSLLFTFIGAAVFSVSRFRHEKIPQEAIIGLTYAIAAAVSILVIDKAPHGAEHLKEILTGSILWVKWSTIGYAAMVYAFIGLFHYLFRRQFLLISNNPEEAYRRGMAVRFWDFLFYVSFGVVITHSVGTAGVLLVFVFLVVPAIISMLLTDILWKQLIIGWGMGLFVSVIGLYISYIADIPSGPTVVSFYGLVLVVIAVFLYLWRAEVRSKALLKISFGIGVTLLIFTGIYFMGQYFKHAQHIHEHHGVMTEEEHLLHEIQVHKKLVNMSEEELASFLENIRNSEKLHQIYDAESDPYVRLKIAERLLKLDRKEGLLLLMDLLETCELPFLREQIVQLVRTNTGKSFHYDPSQNSDENEKALSDMRQYIRSLKTKDSGEE
ncbi:MAG: hypothetical protein Kow0042_02370 [Calditrichia bacterium]